MPGESGATTRDLTTVATTVGPGSAVLRTSLNGISDSITLNVVPLPELAPDATAGLAVDSFTIVEHRSACWFTCRIFIYAPILALRAGTAPVEILKIRFDVVTATTGWCGHGDLHLAAGSAAYVNDMTQYLWFNGLLAFSRDEPLPRVPRRPPSYSERRVRSRGSRQRAQFSAMSWDRCSRHPRSPVSNGRARSRLTGKATNPRPASDWQGNNPQPGAEGREK